MNLGVSATNTGSFFTGGEGDMRGCCAGRNQRERWRCSGSV